MGPISEGAGSGGCGGKGAPRERRPTDSEIRIGTKVSLRGGQVLRERNVVKGEE